VSEQRCEAKGMPYLNEKRRKWLIGDELALCQHDDLGNMAHAEFCLEPKVRGLGW
jgi:hypothetical protein